MKILITGTTGMLGKDLVNILQDEDDYKLFGIYRCKPENEKKEKIVPIVVDLTDTLLLKRILDKIKPDVVIHCAAIVDVELCEKNHKLADALHIKATKILNSNTNTKFIYISSDSIFDGYCGNYNETDIPKPINYYALSKFRGERETLKNNNALVIRTNIYGFHVPLAKSLAEWAINQLINNKRIDGFSDVFFNPLYTKQLARIIKILIESKNIKGIIHAGSDAFISKFDFLRFLALTFDKNIQLVKPIFLDKIRFHAKRPKNTTLNIEKLRNIIKNVPTLSCGLKELKQDYNRIGNT